MPAVDEQEFLARARREADAAEREKAEKVQEQLERLGKLTPERPPFLRLVVKDGMARGEKIVEVWRGSERVGQLPACSVEYAMEIGGISVLKVGVHVNHATIAGGER